MLAPSRSGAYVCLRCQSHAARRRLAATTFQQTRFLSQPSHQDESGAPEKKQKKKSQRKIYPHGRLRGKKGGEVRESSETLPVKSLGKPAEIILLKDADLDRAKDAGEDDEPLGPVKPERSSRKDILDAIAKKGSADAATSTSKSIEELRDTILKRPTELGDIITQEQFKELSEALLAGFSKTQLQKYARRNDSMKRRWSFSSGKNQLPHSAWVPGESPVNEKHLIFWNSWQITGSTPSKTALVELIVETCWQLRTESSLQTGEIDVYDAARAAKLCDEYGVRIVDKIAQARHVKIQFISPKVLRISGDREAATAALRDIWHSQRSTVTAVIKLLPSEPLPSITSASPDASSQDLESHASEHPKLQEEDLKVEKMGHQEMGHEEARIPSAYYVSLGATRPITASDIATLKTTTGVEVKISAEALEETVRPLNAEFRPSQATPSTPKALSVHPNLHLRATSEQQMNDAIRALYAMSDLPTCSTYAWIAIPSRSSLEVRSPFAPSSLPYYARESGEMRPIGTQDKISRVPTDYSSLIAGILEHPRLSEPVKRRESDLWNEAKNTLTTRLGFVCGPRPGSSKAELRFGTQTLFHPGLTHLSPLLSYFSNATKENLHSSLTNKVSFIFRADFLDMARLKSKDSAKPWDARARESKAPFPELRFDFQLPAKTTETAEPVLTDIQLLVKDRNYCIALPNKPIDFAVAQSSSRSLNYEATLVKSVFEPAVEEMIASIKGQGRLRAPVSMKVPIPDSWLSRMTKRDRYISQGWPRESPKVHSAVRYRFVGVEHRQSVPFQADGNSMAISTVEGGRLGARYTELSVTAADSCPEQEGGQSGGKTNSRNRLRKAFETGFKLVELVDRAAKGTLSIHEASADQANALSREIARDAAPVVDAAAGSAQTPSDQETAIHEAEDEEGADHQRAAASG